MSKVVSGSGTQYDDDAELTVDDVVEADVDIAKEIVAGVQDAQAVGHGCDALFRRLEELQATSHDLKVPGVLQQMLVALQERTSSLKASADALAEALPTAANAVLHAGETAATRHKPLADATKDAGHRRPAEADYNKE